MSIGGTPLEIANRRYKMVRLDFANTLAARSHDLSLRLRMERPSLVKRADKLETLAAKEDNARIALDELETQLRKHADSLVAGFALMSQEETQVDQALLLQSRWEAVARRFHRVTVLRGDHVDNYLQLGIVSDRTGPVQRHQFARYAALIDTVREHIGYDSGRYALGPAPDGIGADYFMWKLAVEAIGPSLTDLGVGREPGQLKAQVRREITTQEIIDSSPAIAIT